MVTNSLFLPGEPIQTADGLKPIDCIEEQDTLLTKQGTWMSPRRRLEEDFDGEFCRIKAYGVWEPLKINSDGIVAVCNNSDSKALFQNKNPDLKLKKANNVVPGDYLVLRRYKAVNNLDRYDLSKYSFESPSSQWKSIFESRKRDDIEVNSNLMTIIGWYLAEGWSYRQHVGFTLSINETDNIEQLVEALKSFDFDVKLRKHHPTVDVLAFHKQLSLFLKDNFGNGASEKKIPVWVHNLPSERLERMLFAYIAGDGSQGKNRLENYSVVSVSLNLLVDVNRVCSKLGYYSGITKTASAGVSLIQGRRVNIKDKYQLRFSKYRSNPDERRVFVGDDYIYYRVRQISKFPYCGKVWRIEAKGDGSFCTLGHTVIGHNYLGEGDGSN